MNKKLLYFIITLGLFALCYQVLFHFNGRAIHIFFMETVSQQAVAFLHNIGLDAGISTRDGILNLVSYSNAPILRVESGCDGVDLLALYMAFALAFPGPWKHKLWYVPLGLILVHFFNVIRVASLTVIASHSIEVMEFNHKYTFLILVYAFVFALWFFWIKKFALPHAKTAQA